MIPPDRLYRRRSGHGPTPLLPTFQTAAFPLGSPPRSLPGYQPVIDPHAPIDPFAPAGYHGRGGGKSAAYMPLMPSAPTAAPSPPRPAPPAAPRCHWAGRAAPFGVATRHPAAPIGTRLRLAPGCFAAHLAEVAAGRASVFLLAEHDWDRRLAATGGRGLDVWTDRSALWVSALSREAAAAVAKWARTMPELSAGFDPTVTRPGWDDAGPLTDVLVARLTEVSLVARGNFPGTCHS